MDQLEKNWHRFGSRQIGTIEPEPIDDEYIDGVTNGHKCICGSDLDIGECEVCGITVIGCMKCHLDIHEVEEGAPNLSLGYTGKVSISDRQYHGRIYD